MASISWANTVVDKQKKRKPARSSKRADIAKLTKRGRASDVFDRPACLFMLMGDVARLSRCIDLITEKSYTISNGTIPLTNYTWLAQNIKPFRSWGTYVRSLDVQGLSATGYSAEIIYYIKVEVDRTIRFIELADEHLGSFKEKETNLASYKISGDLVEVGRYLRLAGDMLGLINLVLPPTHRAVDFASSDHDLFRQDVIARPIRAMQNTCLHALDALANLDAAITDGKPESWGPRRNQEGQLRALGLSLLKGQAPLDSYLEIGGHATEDDAQLLYKGFSMILYDLCLLLYCLSRQNEADYDRR